MYHISARHFSLSAGRLLLVLFLFSVLAFAVPAGAAEVAPQRAVPTSVPTTLVRTEVTPSTGYLVIGSSPGGAAVLLDGSLAGSTPLTISVGPGSHHLTLSLAGYQDAGGEAAVTPGGRTTVSYTLTPVRTTTTSTPIAVGTTPPLTLATAAQTPVAVMTSAPLTLATTAAIPSALPGATAIPPSTPVPIPTARIYVPATFPPFSAGISDKPIGAGVKIEIGSIVASPRIPTSSPYAVVPFSPDKMPMAVIEVQGHQILDQGFDWGEYGNLTIAENSTNQSWHFRWATGSKTTTGGVFQVSRIPFSVNSSNWRTPPGLALWGEMPVSSPDKTEWRKFDINLALAANRPPSAKPYHQGTVSMDAWKVPLGIGWVTIPISKVQFGPVSIPVPGGIMFSQEETNLPGTDQPITCPDCLATNHNLGTITSLLLSANQTFYVRAVPVDAKGNLAGTPSLPVEVMVGRPLPPQFILKTWNETVRPPSVRFVSYDPVRLNSEPYHYFVVQGSPWYPKGAHVYLPPDKEETCEFPYINDATCYEEAWGSLSSVIEKVSGALALTWDMIQDFAVDIAANTVFGPIGCSDSDACKDFLKVGLHAVMIAYGVPPTLPSYAELKDTGAEYMVSLYMDEMGVGDAWDALPDDIKKEMMKEGRSAAENIISSFNEETSNRVSGAVGTSLVPDPEYLPHPGIVMVRVYNPNSQPSDPCMLMVRDSLNLYQPEEAVIPSLDPGESFAVPVTLEENPEAFTNKGACPDEVVAAGYCQDCAKFKGQWTSGDGDLYRNCYYTNWKMSLAEMTADDIIVSFSYPKTHISVDSTGLKAPSVQGYIQNVSYPPGWNVEIAAPLMVDPDQRSAPPYDVLINGFRNTGNE